MTIIKFNVTVNAQINIKANTTEGSIDEPFAPQLKMRFESSFNTGNVISIEGLEHSETGQITETETIYQSWVNTQRNISYGFSIVSFPGLLVAVWIYQRGRPTKPKRTETLIDEAIEPFREIIGEAEKPQLKDNYTTISMKTFDDLAKMADTLAKPIIHTRETPRTHVFYVVDGTTRYEHAMTESGIIKKKKEKEE